MWHLRKNSLFTLVVLYLYFHSMACEQYANLCEDLDAQIYNEDDNSEADLELQQLRVLCDALHSNQSDASDKDIDSLPDFDLTRIDSGNFTWIKLTRI